MRCREDYRYGGYKEGVKAKLPALTLYLGLVVIFIVFAVICSMMGKEFSDP